jgi:AraC-like DNA-binding protein
VRPLLERVPLFHSRDVEETRAFYAAKGTGFETIRCGKSSERPEISVNGLYLSSLWFGYVANEGTGVALRMSAHSSSFRAVDRGKAAADKPLGDYYIHVPLRGGIAAQTSGRIVEGNPAQGVAISPGREQVVSSQPGTARLSVSIRGDALNRQLAALLGGEPAHALRFEPELGLEERHGRSLAGMLRWTALDFDLDGGILASPLVASRFEEFVMNWLLLAQPSNYSEAIGRRGPPIAPRDIRRAVDFIHANLAQPIRLAELAEICGVAGRTLLKHFRHVHGVSPMRYVRERRMERVREELAAGSPDAVATVASYWGFAHAGRFSVQYRSRYGESPSATLARGRARATAIR